MQESPSNRNMLHNEMWEKFKHNTRENLHFMIVEWEDERFHKLVRD